MTADHWEPFVNTIKDPTIVPIAHYCDPTDRFDPRDPTHPSDPAGEFVWTACGAGFEPVLPNDHHRMCPDCEAKRTPTSVLVMCDASWAKRNGL